MHFRFKLYRQLSAQLFSFKPRVCKLTFSLAKYSSFCFKTFRSRQLELTYVSTSGLGLSLFRLRFVAKQLGPNFTHSALHRGVGIPCYFIDGRIPIRRTYGVLRRYRKSSTPRFFDFSAPQCCSCG